MAPRRIADIRRELGELAAGALERDRQRRASQGRRRAANPARVDEMVAALKKLRAGPPRSDPVSRAPREPSEDEILWAESVIRWHRRSGR